MTYRPLEITTLEICGLQHALRAMRNPRMSHDKANPEDDLRLAAKLVNAGDEHAKALRGVVAYFELKMQIGWMLEWDTYRIGTEVLSTSSTMHLDHKGLSGPELAAAKQANLPNVIYTQTAMASYQALRRAYLQRRHHRHPDWQLFCNWIETLPHFNTLIIPSPVYTND